MEYEGTTFEYQVCMYVVQWSFSRMPVLSTWYLPDTWYRLCVSTCVCPSPFFFTDRYPAHPVVAGYTYQHDAIDCETDLCGMCNVKWSDSSGVGLLLIL